MNVSVRTLAVVLCLGAPPAAFPAPPDDALLRALACLPVPAQAKLLAESMAKDADGALSFAGPARDGPACISDARMSAAFGAGMIVGKVCSDGIQPLVDIVRQSRPGVREVREKPHPSFITGFKDDRYAITFVRGTARLDGEPLPDDGTISYICGFQGSGPQ